MLQFCYNYYSQIILIRKEELNKDPASISHTLGISRDTANEQLRWRNKFTFIYCGLGVVSTCDSSPVEVRGKLAGTVYISTI